MKKNFFKKLSFVMALAMIISVIAPAAGALAATGLRLNATSKTLMLGENNTYNFNALGKTKGATEKWTTSNAKIAAVNAKNGVVTAKAVGKATITATVTNAKKTVTKKLTAKVTVGDSIKSLEIVAPANAADLAKLEVGTDYDFNRTFETMGGSKTKTSNITVWFVNDAPATLAKAGETDGATIDTAGVFKAEKAGEYTITARAFRYKAQYEAWVKAGSNADDTKYIKASNSVKVTVLNAVKEVKQVNTNTFTVEFAGPVKDLTQTSASVYQVLSGTNVTAGLVQIKSVKLDEAATTATVELFSDFYPEVTYKFVFDGMEGTFKAASNKTEDIAGLVFDDFTVNTTVNTGTDLLTFVHAVNKDGIIILNGADISANLSFELASTDTSRGYVDSALRRAYVYNSGNQITVKAVLTNYVKNASGVFEPVSFTDSAVGTGVSSNVDEATMQFAVKTSQPTSISKAWADDKVISVDGSSYQIYARYKKTTDSSTDPYTYTADTTVFNYTSSDPTKLSVVGNTVYAIAAGAVTVIVKNLDGKVVGSFAVKINPEPVLASVSLDQPSVTVGNNANVGEVKQISVTAYNQTGTVIYTGATISDIRTTQAGAPSVTANGMKITVHARNGAAVGYYQYTAIVSYTSPVSQTVVTRGISFGVNVGDSSTPNSNATRATGYAVAVEERDGSANVEQYIAKSGVDFKDLKAAKQYKVAVYAVNAAGLRVDELDDTKYEAAVKLGNLNISNAAGNTFNASTITSSAVVVSKKVGVYNVTATVTGSGITTADKGKLNTIDLPTKSAGTLLNATSFNLTSGYVLGQTVAYAVDGNVYNTVKTVVEKALNLTVTQGENVYAVSAGDIVEVKGINGGVLRTITNESAVKGSMYISQVTVYLTVNDGITKEFTFDINKSISVK
ncbi:MAG TPA: hypothetical protein GXX75_13115 [Clostridiales bacterium]|nr:hypothetical protein [Clostridiales bacterium]